MALSAWLTLSTKHGGHSQRFRLITSEYSFTQAIDETGKPAAKPKGGIVHMSFESTDNETFVAWMLSKTDQKDGRIEYPLKRGHKIVIEFKDAYCVAYTERYEMESSANMIVQITISANELNIGSVGYSNYWKKND